MKYLISAASIVCIAALSVLASAQETVTVDYQYQGESTASLEGMSGGPITAGSFSDERNDAPDPHTVAVDGDVVRIEPALTTLIQQAYAQGLETAGANVGSGDTPMSIHGNLDELEISQTPEGIEVVIRCQTILRKGSRDAWQTSVYSRTVTDTTDLGEALQTGLDNMVGQLFGDNYFTMQLGIY